jgi:acyl-CoA thioester hydrolase
LIKRKVLRHHRDLRGAVKQDFKFRYEHRVRFAETDLQGIVFNGNYLTYYDNAWTEYFRELGLTYRSFIDRGLDTVLARTTIEYKSPARFDELLEVFVQVSSIGNTSIIFDFEIYPKGEDRLVSTASSLYVCVDPRTLEKTAVPDWLRSAIQEFEGRKLGRAPG